VPVPHVTTEVVVLVVMTMCVRVRVEAVIVATVELLFLEAPTRGPEMKEERRARSAMVMTIDVPILLPNQVTFTPTGKVPSTFTCQDNYAL
jgi:hypothetical protein